MLGLDNQVRFDQYRPDGPEHDDAPTQDLDYSPLPRLTGRSLAMGALVSMGGMVFGYDTGQISGFLEMTDFQSRFGQEQADGSYGFSDVRSGLIVGLLSIGTLVGALCAAPVADSIGRRPSISWSCLVASIGFVVQMAAVSSWVQLAVGRLVAGLGVGALSLLVPMYQAETAPPWIRGAMVSCYQLFITLGILLAALFNLGTHDQLNGSSASWRIVLGLGWLWTLALGLGILAFPETPRFQYRRGLRDQAEASLVRVYGAPANHYAIRVQMEEMEAKRRADEALAGRGALREVADMFSAPRMAYRVLLGVTLQMFQQLTGANYFFYYGTTIFKSVQISSFVTQVILNAINFSVTFIGLYLIEHYGRRKSLMAGSAWMFVCFLVFASVGHFSLDRQDPAATPTAGIVMIVFACLFILGFATTWGPMVWASVSEMYPSRYRAKAMALATASNWIWNFLLAFFTPFITGAIDFRYGYVFAGCNVVGGLLVYFFLVEAKGRSLEEVDTMYIQKVKPWHSDAWVAPSPENMSRLRSEAAPGVPDHEKRASERGGSMKSAENTS